jgi:hypothetical protein
VLDPWFASPVSFLHYGVDTARGRDLFYLVTASRESLPIKPPATAHAQCLGETVTGHRSAKGTPDLYATRYYLDQATSVG